MTEPIDPNPPDWYLQPSYPPPWAAEPAPPWQPPPPPRRRTRASASTLVICCLVLAAVGVAGYYLVHKPNRPDPLPIPVAFDAYTRISSPDTDRMESMMRSMSGAARSAFESAAIGFYSRNTGDVPRLIVIVFPAEVFPGSADEAVDSIQAGLGGLSGNLSSYPPGPRGGKSLCGELDLGSVPEQMCAWADATSAGAMVSVVTPMTPARLAQIEQDFRSGLP
jgi:hypothetical protein